MIAKKIQGFANNFWKYASDTKDILSLEDAYINWADNSGMTIKEFGHVWAKINDDINIKFGLKKADVSFSRIEDILDLADKLKSTETEIDKISPINEPITPESNLNEPIEPSPEIGESPPTPEPDVTEPDLGEGGEPDLKLTESLLL